MSRPLHVLVADDDPITGEATRRHLLLDGHDVAELCRDSYWITNRAVELAQRGLLDVVVLDINWPAGRGYGVHVASVCKRRLPDVAIVFCSSVTEAELRKAAREVGADAWISKDAVATLGARLVELFDQLGAGAVPAPSLSKFRG